MACLVRMQWLQLCLEPRGRELCSSSIRHCRRWGRTWQEWQESTGEDCNDVASCSKSITSSGGASSSGNISAVIRA